MYVQSLKAKKTRVQRLLHLTKRKKLACKLYLKGNPEQASRDMQHYLFTLEQKHKNPRDFITGFMALLALCIVLIALIGIFALPLTYSASSVLVAFLGGLFFIPFFANKYHMAQTRKYIANEVLDELDQRIEWLNERIEKLQEQIEKEWKKYEEWRARSGRQYYESDIKSEMTYKRALQILNLEESADFAEIRSAYRKLIIECHPDRVENMGDKNIEDAKRRTIELNRAYSFLKKKLQSASTE